MTLSHRIFRGDIDRKAVSVQHGGAWGQRSLGVPIVSVVFVVTRLLWHTRSLSPALGSPKCRHPIISHIAQVPCATSLARRFLRRPRSVPPR